jgi:ABC-2 type transport system ATP-binding protein
MHELRHIGSREQSQQLPQPASLTGVTKRYGATTALAGIDITIGRGEAVALLGPNGAGKTTAVRMLLGLAEPTTGQVEVFGANPRLPENRLRTGAMLQVARVPDGLRVIEHVRLFSSYFRNPLPLADIITAAGLQGIEQRPFGKLSGGQKQRVLFALAICGNPDLLVLDEPTVGLDVEARRGLWAQIRHFVATGRSVLLTTHYLEEAEALADRVVVIGRGRVLAEGTPGDIKQRVGGKRIRCTTLLPMSELRSMPGVITVNADPAAPARVELTVADSETVVRELLSRDPGLSGLEVGSGGLEEAIVAMTSNAA